MNHVLVSRHIFFDESSFPFNSFDTTHNNLDSLFSSSLAVPPIALPYPSFYCRYPRVCYRATCGIDAPAHSACGPSTYAMGGIDAPAHSTRDPDAPAMCGTDVPILCTGTPGRTMRDTDVLAYATRGPVVPVCATHGPDAPTHATHGSGTLVHDPCDLSFMLCIASLGVPAETYGPCAGPLIYHPVAMARDHRSTHSMVTLRADRVTKPVDHLHLNAATVFSPDLYS
jgi:hypothetical protein